MTSHVDQKAGEIIWRSSKDDDTADITEVEAETYFDVYETTYISLHKAAKKTKRSNKELFSTNLDKHKTSLYGL